MDIFIATGNAHKLREFREMLAPWGARVSASHLNVQVEESEDNFFGNSRLKACCYAEHLSTVGIRGAVLADDSGLEVRALGGRPGVLSARYAGEQAQDKEHRMKLLQEMAGVEGRAAREARMICVLTLMVPQVAELQQCTKTTYLTYQSSGIMSGWIAEEERSSRQDPFGYDPVFVPAEVQESSSLHGKSLAEIPAQIKNSLSHRQQALKALESVLRSVAAMD